MKLLNQQEQRIVYVIETTNKLKETTNFRVYKKLIQRVIAESDTQVLTEFLSSMRLYSEKNFRKLIVGYKLSKEDSTERQLFHDKILLYLNITSRAIRKDISNYSGPSVWLTLNNLQQFLDDVKYVECADEFRFVNLDWPSSLDTR